MISVIDISFLLCFFSVVSEPYMDLIDTRLGHAVATVEPVANRGRRSSEVNIEMHTNSGKPLIINSIPHILYQYRIKHENKFESLTHE